MSNSHSAPLQSRETTQNLTPAMFNVNAPLLIAGGIFQQINNDNQSTFLIEGPIPKAFRNRVAQGATHDTVAPGDPPGCHPKTRLAILRKLSVWARNNNPTSSLMLWIFGPAGVGKTAIGRSLAEMLARDDRLAASFFFFRTDGKRNNANHFISTLAYQLAFGFPELQPSIAKYILGKPHTAFSQSMETQLEQLIVVPVLQNMEWKHQRAIVIDGLDECHDHDTQRRIMLAIGKIAFRLAGKLKFLVLSRPEYNIEVTFQSLHSDQHLSPFKSLDLKLDLNALDDIRIFLKERFDVLKRKHPLRAKIPSCWPNIADIEKLVWRSSGNFIYPQTVMKYIETTRGRPESRLQVILALKPTHDRPYGDLDNLYRQILKTVEADISLVLKVLGVLHVLNTFGMDPMDRSAESVEAMQSLQPGDIELLLLDLRSLITLEDSKEIYAPAANSRVRIPRFLHKSFSDFLSDQTRSQEFWVDISKARVTTLIGLANIIRQQHLPTERVLQLFRPVVRQEMGDKLVTQMVIDEDIPISDVIVISAALVQDPYDKNIHHSLFRSVLKKYHDQDPFMDIILAILFVVPQKDKRLITVMKCIACILLFHPSSNVASSEVKKLARTYSSSILEDNQWMTAFTYIHKTANGSASRAIKFLAGTSLLPAEPNFVQGLASRFAIFLIILLWIIR